MGQGCKRNGDQVERHLISRVPMDNVDAHGQGAARCGAQVRPSFASAGVRSPG